jgi:hypothetical protein
LIASTRNILKKLLSLRKEKSFSPDVSIDTNNKYFLAEAGNYMQATASSKLKQGGTLERKKPNFLQVSFLSFCYFILVIFIPTSLF